MVGAWREEVTPQRLVASATAAVVLYLLEMIISLSVVALIFSGDLAPHLPRVVGAVLVGNALLVVIVTLVSSYGGSIAVTQDTPGVILAAASASIAAALVTEPDRLLPTVSALLIGCTLAVGIVYLLLGVFKLGGFVRFLPFPVLGGFLAGTGWLLLAGGVAVASASKVDWELFDADLLRRWLPAIGLGALMLAVVRRTGRPALLAVMIAAACAGFYAAMALTGRSPAELGDDGWLLGPFPDHVGWSFPLRSDEWSSIDTSALLAALPIAIPAVVISVIGLLLNTSSLELLTRTEIDLDQELRVAGVANLASGFAGGMIGYHGMAVSTLSHNLARGRRLPGLLVFVMTIATVVAGTSLLSYIPRLLLGGLLAYVGLALLIEWLVESRRAFGRADYAVVLGIFAVIVVAGFVWGVAIGSVLTIALFLVDYSRVEVIRHRLSGATLRSRLVRGPADARVLDEEGETLATYALQGFIFFGTANTLLVELRDRIGDDRRRPLRCVVLDFRQVTGLDSTAVLSFAKLLDLTRRAGVELVVTELSASFWNQLGRGGFGDDSEGLHRFADLDRGLEWCEELILAACSPSAADGGATGGLLALIPDPDGLAALLGELDRLEISPGETLIVEGGDADSLFLIESGTFTAELARSDRSAVRLQTTRGAQLLGELGFFLGTARTATVRCDSAAVVYRLTTDRWATIRADHPELAHLLDGAVIRLLSYRLAHLTRVVDALQGE